MGPGEHHDIQQIHVQDVAPGSWQLPLPMQAWGCKDGEEQAENNLGYW